MSRCQKKKLLLDFMVQGGISDADTPTIRLGATPSGLISDPPPSSPIFTLDALPAATLPIYPGFGQVPNMLACIPSGLVQVVLEKRPLNGYLSEVISMSEEWPHPLLRLKYS